ncbi:amidohydrolase [Leucobacter aridicollis]|uniref:amidohydrolase n=1 Tax=Leucobacter aridicollis TaxID=283878 RepID=UPI0021037865|nr:amidohydrolase [Leucobacter aridicollis]UTX53520.1 amidohydrolase [Leucobacter aridicollis]
MSEATDQGALAGAGAGVAADTGTGSAAAFGSGGSLAVVGARLRRNVAESGEGAATAILIEGGVITAVGTDDEIRQAAPAGIEIIDARGGTLTPGLWDSHAHPDSGAVSTRGIDLGGVSTIAELRDRLAAEHARLAPGEWLEGWNLEYEMFEVGGIDRSAFEEVTGDRPVFLRFYDGHTGLASGAALAAAGVEEPIRYPDGSETVVDETGRFTGELCEMSVLSFMTEAVPMADLEAELDRLEAVLLRFAAAGLTGCAIMDGGPRTREMLRELESRGRLPQRIVVHEWHRVHFTDADQDRIIAAKDERGRLWEGGAVKLFSDGVIDTGTALLHELDTQGEGLRAAWPEWPEYLRVLGRYHDAGMLVATHAVGDRAVNDVLDAYADLPARAAGLPAHSIEHLEVMSDADVAKLGGSGITASMQPLHMQWRREDNSDNWSQRLGEDRWGTGYRAQSVLDAGARLTLGSDWPVADYDPRVGMAWARGRHDPSAGQAPFEPGERLTGEDTLLAYTLWPALARGHSDRGHLSVGAVGDVTLFGGDPVAAKPEALPGLPVLLTVVDGRVVHRSEGV